MLISGTTGIDLTGLPINNSGNTEVEGNLNLSGVGKRITCDFSNATESNKTAFQTNTTNSATVVGIVPNGTSTTAVSRIFNSSDVNNSSTGNFRISNDVGVWSSKFGTGSYLPLRFYTSDIDRMTIDTAGNVGIGTSSPANSKFNRTFTTQVTGTSSVAITAGDYSSGAASTVTAIESLGARGDGNGTFGGRFGASYRRTNGEVIPAGNTIGYYAFGGQWGTDVGYVSSKHLYTASICGVAEGAFTSSTAMATGISFRTGSTGESLGDVNTNYGTEKMRIDSSGNVLLTSATGALGYGTGAGGTVNQLTSKSTAVTLNKPTGQIFMNNAALAAGASVQFTVNNSMVKGVDNVFLTNNFGASYSIRVVDVNDGNFYILVKNESAGSLSDLVPINFTVIKGAQS